jgi:uncharacterized membrane protein HdeD (DUF308 family)
MSDTTGRGVLDDAERLAGRWWLFLFSGMAWIFFAFLLLSFDMTTVWGVAVFAAVGFILGGVLELTIASAVPSWRWVHLLLGVASIGAGIVALVWPGSTFLVLAAIVGWYLMINGVVDTVVAFMARDVDDLWWLSLIVGIAQVLIGFWAIGYAERSIVLLVVWVAAAALARGLSSIFLAFGLHQAKRAFRQIPADVA